MDECAKAQKINRIPCFRGTGEKAASVKDEIIRLKMLNTSMLVKIKYHARQRNNEKRIKYETESSEES